MQIKLRNCPQAYYDLFILYGDMSVCDFVWYVKGYESPSYAKKVGLSKMSVASEHFPVVETPYGKVLQGDSGKRCYGFRIKAKPYPFCSDAECDVYDFDVSGECVGVVKGVR